MNEGLLQPLSTFIVASFLLYGWIYQRIEMTGQHSTRMNRPYFVSWVCFVLALVVQAHSRTGTTEIVFFAGFSLVLTTISFVSLCMAGFIGIRVIEVVNKPTEDGFDQSTEK